MTTGEIITLLQARGYRHNRALGQHFLADDEILSAIVEESGVDRQTNVLEIGPGAGVLTGPLCAAAKRVLAIELDRALIPVLETVLGGMQNVALVRDDVMRVDIPALTRHFFEDEGFDVVSNLPYSITTPVLTLLLMSELPIRRITVMVQQEAAERITALEGKAYGPLSILAAYRADVARLMDVPRGCFVPPPHVDSVVLRMDIARRAAPAADEGQFFRLVRAAFAMRRKTLANNLKPWKIPPQMLLEMFRACGIDERARAEQVPMDSFVALSNQLVSKGYVIFHKA